MWRPCIWGSRCSVSLRQQRIMSPEAMLGSLDRDFRDRPWTHSFITASSSACKLHIQEQSEKRHERVSCVAQRHHRGRGSGGSGGSGSLPLQPAGCPVAICVISMKEDKRLHFTHFLDVSNYPEEYKDHIIFKVIRISDM